MNRLMAQHGHEVYGVACQMLQHIPLHHHVGIHVAVTGKSNVLAG